MKAADLLCGSTFVLCLVAVAALPACGEDDSSESSPDTDADSDTDSDTDVDSDTDTDSDADPDTWAVQISGPGYIDAEAVDYLSDGSLVVAGTFEDTAVFGDDEAELTAEGESNLFLTRIDGDGQVIWATMAGHVESLTVRIAAQADDTILVSGVFSGTLVLGHGEPNETALDGGDESSFVAGYKDDGTLAWAELTNWIDGSASMTTPVADGSVFLTRLFTSSIMLDEGGPNETELLGPGSEDHLAARYSTDGALEWAASITGIDDLFNPWVDPQPDGSLVFGAADVTNSPITLNYGSPGETAFQGPVGVFARYDTDGSLDWAAETLLTESTNQGKVRFSGATLLDEGSLVGFGMIVLEEGDEVTFGPGEANETVLADGPEGYLFLARYAADGSLEWVETITDAGPGNRGSITTADDGSVLVKGFGGGSCVFDEGGPNETMAYAEFDFVAKYGVDGTFEQVWYAGGYPSIGLDLAAGPDGTFALVGNFSGEVGFWGDEPDPLTLTSDEELYDAFVVQQSY